VNRRGAYTQEAAVGGSPIVTVGVLILGLVWAGESWAEDVELLNPGVRFDLRAVRVESPMGAVLYRMDRETGEVCAYSFATHASGELRGCLGRGPSGRDDRYSLDAVAGARGTSQSSAYRLDRATGQICRFRLKGPNADVFEAAGCIGSP
jgi:hypothetical protein